MDYLILSSLGLVMGFFGGLLGIGGSAIMIPALVLLYSGSENQHLFQASAMICNFFIAAPAVLSHYRAGAIQRPIVIRLIPAASAGMLAGVVHAPLTAIFLIAEITGGYELFFPIMIVSTTSYSFSRLLSTKSIYTIQMSNRGDMLTHNKDKSMLSLMNLKEMIAER